MVLEMVFARLPASLHIYIIAASVQAQRVPVEILNIGVRGCANSVRLIFDDWLLLFVTNSYNQLVVTQNSASFVQGKKNVLVCFVFFKCHQRIGIVQYKGVYIKF